MVANVDALGAQRREKNSLLSIILTTTEGNTELGKEEDEQAEHLFIVGYVEEVSQKTGFSFFATTAIGANMYMENAHI
jgi:hypothetical protein